MYVMVHTRVDLEHVVSQVCKFLYKSRKPHWEEDEWIFKYLKGRTSHAIMFNSEQGDLLVVGYFDRRPTT